MTTQHHLTRLRRFVPLLLLALWLAACSSPTTGTPPPSTQNLSPHPLQTTSWVLHEVDGELIDLTQLRKAPYLIFRPVTDRVEGYGGCNGFFTSYNGDEQTLLFGDIASSRMACREGEAIEREFFKALQKTNRYQVIGSYLLLYDNDTLLARLKPRPRK